MLQEEKLAEAEAEGEEQVSPPRTSHILYTVSFAFSHSLSPIPPFSSFLFHLLFF